MEPLKVPLFIFYRQPIATIRIRIAEHTAFELQRGPAVWSEIHSCSFFTSWTHAVGPSYQNILTLLPACISYYTHYNVYGEIT